jgi:hypothetical protein
MTEKEVMDVLVTKVGAHNSHPFPLGLLVPLQVGSAVAIAGTCLYSMAMDRMKAEAVAKKASSA